MADKLSLYMTPICPFCHRVRAAIDELGLDVEMRDIMNDDQHAQDLLAARGRVTVPVLRVDKAKGKSEWMPESLDIIAYLKTL